MTDREARIEHQQRIVDDYRERRHAAARRLAQAIARLRQATTGPTELDPPVIHALADLLEHGLERWPTEPAVQRLADALLTPREEPTP